MISGARQLSAYAGRMTTSRIAVRGALSAVGVIALALGPATAASAAPIEAGLVPTDPATITAEYGQQWQMQFTSDYQLDQYRAITVDLTGVPSTVSAFGWGTNEGYGEWRLNVIGGRGSQVLDAGTYRVGLEIWASSFGPPQLHGVSRATQTLVIEPAALTTSIDVAPDVVDPQSTVITMQLGGSWLTESPGYEYLAPWSADDLQFVPAPPAGTWSLTVTDDAGTVLLEQQFDTQRAQRPALSYRWADAPAATPVVIAASFAPTADEAGNFAVAPAEPIAYTTGESTRPIVQAPVIDTVPVAESPTGIALPLIALIAVAVIGIGSAISAGVIALRRRRPTASLDLPDADSNAAEGADSEGVADDATVPVDEDTETAEVNAGERS